MNLVAKDFEHFHDLDEFMNFFKHVLIQKESQSCKFFLNILAEKHYFKNCSFEPYIDEVLFYILNYSIYLINFIDTKTLSILRDIFSHCDESHKIVNKLCEVDIKIYQSSWLRIYLESTVKIYNFNLFKINNVLIEFLIILFDKKDLKLINLSFVPTINFIIEKTIFSFIKRSNDNIQIDDKIFYLIVSIIDGHYQLYVEASMLKKIISYVEKIELKKNLGVITFSKDGCSKIRKIIELCRSKLANF